MKNIPQKLLFLSLVGAIFSLSASCLGNLMGCKTLIKAGAIGTLLSVPLMCMTALPGLDSLERD